MATKRMSHANCDHPKTPNERAKCRSQHNTRNQARENVRVVTNQAHPSVSELADMLADSLSGLKSAKDLVLQREGEVAELQASLAEQMLQREPRSVDGQMPVVAFEKRFRSDGSKAYHYAALGVETEMIRRERIDGYEYYLEAQRQDPPVQQVGAGEGSPRDRRGIHRTRRRQPRVQGGRVMAELGGHQQYVCPGYHDTFCMFCDGGLFACTVCGSFEGACTTECPGRRMTETEADAVYDGTLDYRDGAWRGVPSLACPGHSPGWSLHRDCLVPDQRSRSRGFTQNLGRARGVHGRGRTQDLAGIAWPVVGGEKFLDWWVADHVANVVL